VKPGNTLTRQQQEKQAQRIETTQRMEKGKSNSKIQKIKSNFKQISINKIQIHNASVTKPSSTRAVMPEPDNWNLLFDFPFRDPNSAIRNRVTAACHHLSD